MLHMDQL